MKTIYEPHDILQRPKFSASPFAPILRGAGGLRRRLEGEDAKLDFPVLQDLHAEYPEDQLFFITGADALEQILTWHRADDLFDLAHFIGVTRPGYRLNKHHLPSGKVSLVEVTAMSISSTDCRDRVERGEPVWYLVPDGVVRYIAKKDLYRKRD